MKLNGDSEFYGLPNVLVLKLSNTQIQEDFGMQCLTKVFPNVEHLELNRLEHISDTGITTLYKKLKNLKFLDI